MEPRQEELTLLKQVLEIYDQKYVAEYLNAISPDDWCRETINRWLNGKASPRLSHNEYEALQRLLPPRPQTKHEFDFIDLFAGIGGIRRGFEDIGGRCVLTSEWNKFSVQTYKANYYSDPQAHIFNEDIRQITLSDKEDVSEDDAYKHIDASVPKHDVLLAGFPCQPFSIAGVSKKNSLGLKHGFECKTQGTLFFDVARIIAVKRPAAFVLENVKNLKSHDKGRTFKVITETLEELGYWISDMQYEGTSDPKIVDGIHFVPQHRERIVLVGFRKDLEVHSGFSLKELSKQFPKQKPILSDILEDVVDDKYILTPKLWEYLFNYSIKHKEKGNGFGYGLVKGTDTTRTLSARYHKDGSEILIDRGFNPEKPLSDKKNQKNRPRRLTPRECARLMGYDSPETADFRIPVSDTQAYRQFGNSVVVPVFAAVAKLMKPYITAAKKRDTQKLAKAA
ncbi:DNA (cytosine-5-)-methyltransferase [Herbaspirillum lusitanum]|uniref:DNA (cytosine-5-)-methyltransferase n=1 Tax=Herbaspirillum lusitanum TaxID=213312 RepID=UPI002237977B|nr:DNA (cytosine-5-)-methyltransferase [Herbaspirillum lusitanum]MCW5296562.1 DNA (cytosine-5-)-methyltransferase [Herbaspirillum lusitanum]